MPRGAPIEEHGKYADREQRQPERAGHSECRRRRNDGALDIGVRVGVSSDEGPAAIVERADLVVDGVQGFAGVLAVLAES